MRPKSLEKIKVASQDLESAKLFKIVGIEVAEGVEDDRITTEIMSLSDFKHNDTIRYVSQGQIVNAPNFSFNLGLEVNPEYTKIEDYLALLKKKRDSILDNKERNSEQRKREELEKCDEFEKKLKNKLNSTPPRLMSPLPAELVQKFKQAVGSDKKGVYLQWDKDLSEGVWYIEFIGSEVERTRLLNSISDTLMVRESILWDDEIQIDTAFIKAVLKKSGSKIATSLRKIKLAQLSIKKLIKTSNPS